jgi:hypothetical protein
VIRLRARPARRGGDDAVVVEPQKFDHVADVGLVLDAARRWPHLAGEDGVVDDPSLLSQFDPHLFREHEVGCMVAVQVPISRPPSLKVNSPRRAVELL